MRLTCYLDTYGLTARELAGKMIRAVLRSTEITATAGIGTNLYLSKVAMDIVAKHIPADQSCAEYQKAIWKERDSERDESAEGGHDDGTQPTDWRA